MNACCRPLKAVVFDLDGTLVNSMPDIMYAVNQVVSCIGMGMIPEYKVRKAVGNGVEELLRRLGVPEQWVESLSLEMASIYSGTGEIRSAPYEGVPELLSKARHLGLQVCVLSNKPQGGVERSLETHFPELRFAVARGSLPGKPAKPGGEVLGQIIDELGFFPDEFIVCGDGESDILAAAACGVSCISVLWGYRSKEELQRAGGTLFAKNVPDLEEMLMLRVQQPAGSPGNS